MQQNVTCNHCLHEKKKKKKKKKSAVNDKMTFSLLSQKQIMKFCRVNGICIFILYITNSIYILG